jgi:SAM-dependent methyltransferase
VPARTGARSRERTGFEEQLRVFSAALAVVRETPFDPRPNDPNPAGYYKALFDEAADRAGAERKRLGYYADLFRVARLDPAGARIVEAGSGFGVGLVALACLGAGRVSGIEIVDWQAEWARECVARLDPPLRRRIDVHTGDVGRMPLDDSSVDVLLSLEAISHYLDYEPFLHEARRVLRPGGTLIVSDGNNALNRRIVRATERMWADHESDPRLAPSPSVDEGEYDPWRLVDHRRRIVLETAPELPDDTAWRLAFNTSGMVRRQIVEATERYLATGEEPDSPYRPGVLIVHPDQEIVIERLFDPYELGREIAALGFDVRVRGHWAGATGRRHQLANDALAALGPLSMRFARGFRIIATRS